ncbi:abscission/NoCut checkpoint regulator-like isoform X2 [Littorina saxatilis]|uniref:FYVE-type domain-containing protein n=1 Tax=Littorina saxatilis TaxID=31220 RepID=A0AAN9BFD8_9CAEN
MPGQCYACGAEFGLFKKEQGCKNCGFAFCSRCLTKKAAIPKEKLDSRLQSKGSDKETQHVCNKCYDILTGKTKPVESGRRTPPEALLKRMAALEQKEASGASLGSHQKGGGSKANAKYAALDKPDRDIAERLDRLKEKPKEQKVLDKDLNERLARLKGENPAVRSAPTKPVYHPPDTRTQVEQIDELLDEIANEVEIDSHGIDPVADVENRLSSLRGDQTGARKEDQNNLDKNNPMPQKKFVKNIDVGTRSTKGAAGEDGKSGEDLDFEEVQALMARAAADMEQDAQKALQDMQKDKELMERLTVIKQRQEKKDGQADLQSIGSNVDNTEQDDDDSEDEETAAKRIMQQFLEESKLDDQVGETLATGPEEAKASKAKSKASKSKAKADSTGKGPQKETNIPKGATADADSDYEDPDELPYCIICTEDALIRCIDCDMDLYCNRCFKEGHKDLGLTDHRSVPYKAPKGYR